MGDRSSGTSPLFPRTPSESAIGQQEQQTKRQPQEKNWERSQSEVNLDHRGFVTVVNRSPSVQETDLTGRVSESSKVYWDLSKATDDGHQPQGGTSVSVTSSSTKPVPAGK